MLHLICFESSNATSMLERIFVPYLHLWLLPNLASHKVCRTTTRMRAVVCGVTVFLVSCIHGQESAVPSYIAFHG